MKKTAVLLLALLCCSACAKKDDFSAEDGDVQRAEQVTIFESKDSQKKWLLQADQVDFEDLSNAVLTNPRLLLRENGQDSAEVSGQKGTFDYNHKLVSIEGKAKIKSFTQQINLATDRFFYDVDKDKIWSDKKTIVTRGTAKITARGGIETDSKLVKIEFKKQSTRLPENIQEIQGAV
ncbi:MAG: LPS export ABC transporter periplasmic protein LptC [Elusimicrobiaceae bacterium]|nr:LPS export ABC transporter periplasmic protein LptC [Elusimicrobiaceae bacterium]